MVRPETAWSASVYRPGAQGFRHARDKGREAVGGV